MAERLYQELHLPLPVSKTKNEKPKQQRGVAVLRPDGTWEEDVPPPTVTPGDVEYEL